ncbi:MAG TPA: hypothetical protein VJS64_01515 [Pyrinomonadaceae bacterium]|nr:hypothetical protein [Pyrinomonadaceae bacterium]
MKACMVVMLFMFVGMPCMALAQNDGSGVVVLKYSWERETIQRRASMAAIASQDELVQQSQRERQLAAARNTGDRMVATRIEKENEIRDQATVKANQGRTVDGYRYKVTLRNDSAKTIKSIDWDYVFIDQAAQQLIARHQFTSDVTIKPGKIKEIYVLYLTPPVRTVSAERLASKEPLPYSEHIVIARITYSDRSIWQHP